MSQQVGAQGEGPRREGHGSWPVLDPCPEGRQPERDGPDPERTETHQRQQRRLVSNRVVDERTEPGPIDGPEDRRLLELPEGQRRAHPGDPILLAEPPPLSPDPQVSHLVVCGRTDQGRIDEEHPPTISAATTAASQIQDLGEGASVPAIKAIVLGWELLVQERGCRPISSVVCSGNAIRWPVPRLF